MTLIMWQEACIPLFAKLPLNQWKENRCECSFNNNLAKEVTTAQTIINNNKSTLVWYLNPASYSETLLAGVTKIGKLALLYLLKEMIVT